MLHNVQGYFFKWHLVLQIRSLPRFNQNVWSRQIAVNDVVLVKYGDSLSNLNCEALEGAVVSRILPLGPKFSEKIATRFGIF